MAAGFASKYLYVGFSYPFICILVTWRSSTDAFCATSTNPRLLGVIERCRRITTPTMMTIKTVMLPMTMPSVLPVWTALAPFIASFFTYAYKCEIPCNISQHYISQTFKISSLESDLNWVVFLFIFQLKVLC